MKAVASGSWQTKNAVLRLCKLQSSVSIKFRASFDIYLPNYKNVLRARGFMNQQTNDQRALKPYISRIRIWIHDIANRIQHIWETIKFPFIVYWVFRLYYSIIAAILTFVYHPPYEEFVSYSDPFSKYFLMNWEHWDVIWYLRIAVQGYQASDGRSVFPPLYPYLIRALNGQSGNYLLTAMTISMLAGCCTVIMLYLITNEVVGGKSGETAILLLLSFPTSTFFFSAYTESLFLALSLGMFITAKNGKFGLASALAILAILTRYQGVILVVPLGWLIWKSVNIKKRSWSTFAYAIIPILSLLIFLWVRSKWIDPTPMEKVYEQYWKSRFVLPGESIIASIRALPNSLNIHYFINLLDFSLLFVMILISPLVVRFLPPEYWLYQISTLFVLLLRVGPIDNPLQGMGRYMLLMFPSFMIVSRNLQWRKNRFILISSLLISTWILTMYILGTGIVS